MSQEIEVTIRTKDKTKGGIDAAKMNLREFGEKVSNLGMRMTAAFTLPLVGLGMMLLKNEELKKSLEPIQAAFKDVVDKLALSLIPVVKDLTPTLISLADSLGKVVGWFSGLTVEQKETILAALAVIAAIGPLITIIGQLIGFIGTLQVVWGTLSAFLSGPAVAGAIAWVGTALSSLGAALAPVGAAIVAFLGGITLPVWGLIAAIGLLIAVIVLWGEEAWNNAVAIEKAWLEILGALPGFIGRKLSEAWEAIKAWFNQAGTDIGNWFSGLGTDFTNWFNQAGKDIGDFFGKARDKFNEAITKIREMDWGSIGKTIVEKVVAALRSGASWLGDVARSVAQDALNRALAVFGAIGTGGASFPAMQGRAFGGFVMPGTPYLVGERGVPEMFVPSGGGNIVPLSAAPQGGMAPVQFVYQPMFSLADRQEAEDRLMPFIRSALRSVNG